MDVSYYQGIMALVANQLKFLVLDVQKMRVNEKLSHKNELRKEGALC
jgi:hypothetical protein